MEIRRGYLRLNTLLCAVTAAVVGVVLNLAVWFAWHVIRPMEGTYDFLALALGLAFFVALKWFKWDVLWVVGAGAVAGLAAYGVNQL